ncbi:MAG: ATP synthase F1 subunit gamma [Bacteroidota bacterium]
MANLKEIRTRIGSIKSTRQITSAMKMVTAAKLRKAQDAVIQMRPYAGKLQEILSNVSNSLDHKEENVYGALREINRVLLIVITSNKGLCGAFNSSIIKLVQQHIKNTYAVLHVQNKVDIITIGKKGNDFLKIREYDILENHSELFDNLSFENVLPLIEKIMRSFVEEKYDKVEIIYNQFKNAAVQEAMIEPFLPLTQPEDEMDYIETTSAHYIFEPTKEYIIHELIPKSLKIQFYKTLLDSHAAEHGARMTAMHKATDNATDLLKELTVTYNKARQASITNEILEIVGGAEALNKG